MFVVSFALIVQAVPLSYNARTDRVLVPEGTLPVLGGAGYTFVDPDFGSRMVRVTDENTNVNAGGNNWQGRAYFTTASAEQNTWNTDSTRFFVMMSGGNTIPFNFNPATMAVTRYNRSIVNWYLGYPGTAFVGAEWSRANPDVIY